MYLNEMCNGIYMVKHSFDAYSIQNVLKQGNAFLPLLFNFALDYAMISNGGLELNGIRQLQINTGPVTIQN